MTKLLHIDSSVLGSHSVSRQLSAAIVDKLKQTTPDLDVVYRDLTSVPLAHFSATHLAAARGDLPDDPAMRQELAASQAVLDEFLAADIVVLGAPMYNFSLPSQLKAWIDRIFVPGKTFRYTPQGPEGLAGHKRMVVALSRGGHYGPGSPTAALEHLETYLRGIFGVIGITAPEFIAADGIQAGPGHREKALASALQAVSDLRAA